MIAVEAVPPAAPPGPVGLLVGGDRITTSSGASHEHIYPATGQPNATIVLAGPAEGWKVNEQGEVVGAKNGRGWLTTSCATNQARPAAPRFWSARASSRARV